MNKALDHAGTQNANGNIAGSKPLDWRRGMSDNVAYALLVYTALNIFVTVKAMAAGGNSMLPYFALVVLIVAIIPACRSFEKRWIQLNDDQASDPSMRGAYRRDQGLLWLFAFGLPLVVTGITKLLLG